MKPGRFWFSVPSPYNVHAPTDGRTNCELPVCSCTNACGWFGMSVCMLCTMHNSSACFATLGNNSEIHNPLCPRCSNLNGEGNSLPFPGPDLPPLACSFGL